MENFFKLSFPSNNLIYFLIFFYYLTFIFQVLSISSEIYAKKLISHIINYKRSSY